MAGLPALTLSAPPGSYAIAGVRGAGQSLAQNWPQAAEAMTSSGTDPASMEAATGLKLPGDLEALLGKQLSIGVTGSGESFAVTMTVDSDSPELAASLERLQAALAMNLPDAATVVPRKGGYTLHVGSGQPGQPTAGPPSTEAFRAAVPDAARASGLVYLDIAEATKQVSSDLSDEEAAAVKALQAVGMTVVQDASGNSEFRLRLTTR